jgi:glycosyltransferase involved in cell wall biosynthesis
VNILVVHNYYQQAGGEDCAFTDEAGLLRRHGNRVTTFQMHNDAAKTMSSWSLAKATHWNGNVHDELRGIIREHEIDVCHFHNTFPLISPAAYYAARREGAVVVQTLHNFRLICPGATLFRDGRVCEDCVGKAVPWPSVVHGCYRNSKTVTTVVAGMLATHRVLRTWSKAVDVYIALTEFARHKMIEGGLPAGKIVVKRNFLEVDPGPGPAQGKYALFIGRLVPEKGIGTMLSAWQRLNGKIPLKIVGTGPMASVVTDQATRIPDVEYLGRVPDDELDRLLGNASFLVFPSGWYEGLPRTIIESFAKGTPVLASNLGSMSTLVCHGRTGLHFRAGDPDDLARTVTWAVDHADTLAAMRHEVRVEFELNYTAEENYRQLLAIYQRAVAWKTVTPRADALFTGTTGAP